MKRSLLLLLLPTVSALHLTPLARLRSRRPCMQYGQQQQQPYWQQEQHNPTMQAVVRYMFEASQQEQLSIYPGDVVEHVVPAEQEWWSGSVRGQSGWFPANCVEVMNSNAAPHNAVGRDAGAEQTIADISERLREPQVRIVRAVVDFLGTQVAYDLLYATEDIQARGGMIVPDTGRPRTSGGIYYRLLKDATHLPRDAQESALRRIKAEGKRVKSWEKAVAW